MCTRQEECNNFQVVVLTKIHVFCIAAVHNTCEYGLSVFNVLCLLLQYFVSGSMNLSENKSQLQYLTWLRMKQDCPLLAKWNGLVLTFSAFCFWCCFSYIHIAAECVDTKTGSEFQSGTVVTASLLWFTLSCNLCTYITGNSHKHLLTLALWVE